MGIAPFLTDFWLVNISFQNTDRLAGLVVKAFASGAEDLGFESRLRRDFSGSSHTSDLKIGTPVATLPGAWHYSASAGTGQSSVSILWLGEGESLICSFYLSVAASKIVSADLSQRYYSMLLGRYATNQQTISKYNSSEQFQNTTAQNNFKIQQLRTATQSNQNSHSHWNWFAFSLPSLERKRRRNPVRKVTVQDGFVFRH